MIDIQDEFLNELLNDFKIEAQEHIENIISGLINLERCKLKSDSDQQIEIIFRETHSLKGAARAVNQLYFENICMNLEDIFQKRRKNLIEFDKSMFDVFYKVTDLLNNLLSDLVSNKENIVEKDVALMVKELNKITNKTDVPPPISFFDLNNSESTTEPAAVDIKSDLNIQKHDEDSNIESDSSITFTNQTLNQPVTIRVYAEKLYDVLRLSEELISLKSKLNYQIDNINQIKDQFIASGRMKLNFNTVEPDAIENQENNISLGSIKNHIESLNNFINELTLIQRESTRYIDDLVLETKKTLLQPISGLLSIIPKIVRDLAKSTQKEVKLVTKGDAIEIDRRILEEMKDPIIHIIRNCVDHGIEAKPDRINQGKNPEGAITIEITQDLNQNIILTITDDGAGINKKKLKEIAISSKYFTEEEINKMNDAEINMLIFQSGISTSGIITNVSGRGLGMAIVLEKISKLGGAISIDSVEKQYTKFIITLPQTLATFRGILISTADQKYIIPTNSVLRVIYIKPENIKIIESKKTILFRNEQVGILNLSDVLGLPTKHNPGKNKSDKALIINYNQRNLAFIVDEIYGEYEGVVKNLGPQLIHIRNISSCTILGDGKIIPILHIGELIESATGYGVQISNSEPTPQNEEKSILLAEDSITIRNLLRSVIEAAGFKVKTAVDGVEALSFAQNENFDLVVSDIEMPKMNGFDLTMRIRNNPKTKDWPVILVTALESEDDKTRGMNVGANAYIIKGNFEKSNLIETINRLI